MNGLVMSASGHIASFRLTLRTFDRDRTIGASKVHATKAQLVAVPQILSPVLVATLPTLAGSDHPLLFLLAGAFFLVGAALVLPIRSVR